MNQPSGHLSEIAALLLLEGRLDSAEARGLSSHAAGCAACAALLQALGRESGIIRLALLEEDEPLPARLLRVPWLEPSRGTSAWLHWIWGLAFGLVAAACYLVWSDFLGPWSDQLDQAGIQGSTLLVRLAVTGAFWEGWSNMLDTLLYAIGISVAVAVLILWSLPALLRHRRAATSVITLAGIFLLPGFSALGRAAEIRRGPEIIVPAGQTVQNDLIAAGRTVRIDGTVSGDLIAFSQEVTLDGHVAGDVIAFGDAVRISGQVDGNVRCFCNTMMLDTTVGKNLSAFAQRVELNPQSVIRGGVIAFARDVISDGQVNRDLLLFAADTTVNGAVGGDVVLRGGTLSVGPSANIAGGLRVTSNARPDILAGARLGRPLEFRFVQRAPRRLAGLALLRLLVSYGVAFLCGLLLIKLFPGLFAAGREAARRVGLAMSIGALLLIAGTALVLFSVMLLLAGTAAGVATMALYIPILYGSQVFVGVWIGEKLLASFRKPGSPVGQLAAGLAIFRLLGLIPFLGFFVWAAALLWGTGAIGMALWNRTRLETAAAAA